eukprot:scaffold6342_cov206-Alexandrium_tamarense.AAC.55
MLEEFSGIKVDIDPECRLVGNDGNARPGPRGEFIGDRDGDGRPGYTSHLNLCYLRTNACHMA